MNNISGSLKYGLIRIFFPSSRHKACSILLGFLGSVLQIDGFCVLITEPEGHPCEIYMYIHWCLCLCTYLYMYECICKIYLKIISNTYTSIPVYFQKQMYVLYVYMNMFLYNTTSCKHLFQCQHDISLPFCGNPQHCGGATQLWNVRTGPLAMTHISVIITGWSKCWI